MPINTTFPFFCLLLFSFSRSFSKKLWSSPHSPALSLTTAACRQLLVSLLCTYSYYFVAPSLSLFLSYFLFFLLFSTMQHHLNHAAPPSISIVVRAFERGKERGLLYQDYTTSFRYKMHQSDIVLERKNKFASSLITI